jgi:6-phosphogluconolactonase
MHNKQLMRHFILGLLYILILAPAIQAQDSYLFIGSYTSNKDGTSTGSKGIYTYRFHSDTGKLDSIGVVDAESPSFIAVSANNDYLYAGTDTRTKGEGSVSAFDINKSTGKLTFINKQPSGGSNPLYVEVAPNNTLLLAANYGSGSFSMFKLMPDGSISERMGGQQYEGSSVNPERQEQSHPHMATIVPYSPFIIVTDLGTDKVMVYFSFSQSGLQLKTTIDTTGGAIIAGNGPRHIVVDPKGKYAYLLEELSGTIAVFSFNVGDMALVERVAMHPESAQGPFSGADIHFSPDGNYLYASNRGNENNIVIYKVNKRSGRLGLVGYQSTLGSTPRNFTIDPTGNYLLVANQSTGNVVVFKRDKKSGLLTPTGETINVPQPSCLKMIWK